MEFGPRALGARSILGDPRSPAMQKKLNLKVKYRESFRPFAPSVLREDVSDWFELDADSPYMLLVAESGRTPPHDSREQLVRHRQAECAAVGNPGRHPCGLFGAHPDRSPQTNPLYHPLLSRFKALTGCPVLVNTSFNVRGEPIVCTPEDAFRCFMGNELDVSWSATACCRRPTRTPISEVTTACHSIPIDAAFYSITSSAPLMSEGENSMPRILAAFRLMKSSTFVTSWTGRSEGFSP